MIATKMTAIADKIRNLLGLSEKMGLDAIDTNLGEIVTEVAEQANLISQIAAVLKDKAGENTTLPTGILHIHENGPYDVVDYAEVAVEVPTTKYCTVVFPENHISETLYYTNKDHVFTSYKRITNQPLTIQVLLDSIILSDLNVFDGLTYTWPDSESNISLYKGHGIVIRSATNFGYADGAPV